MLAEAVYESDRRSVTLKRLRKRMANDTKRVFQVSRDSASQLIVFNIYRTSMLLVRQPLLLLKATSRLARFNSSRSDSSIAFVAALVA